MKKKLERLLEKEEREREKKKDTLSSLLGNKFKR